MVKFEYDLSLIRVFDNFFPESVHSEVWNNVNPCKPRWSFNGGHTTTRIWHMDNLEKDPFFSDYLHNIICYRLQDKVKDIHNYKISRSYANGQTAGQYGTPHHDDGDLTLLYYPNPKWKWEYQGNLVFLSEGMYPPRDPDADCKPEKIIAYKPNRAVLFPAKIFHYAEAPGRKFNGLRVSLAYKLITPKNLDKPVEYL
jgi:hypothetical protein